MNKHSKIYGLMLTMFSFVLCLSLFTLKADASGSQQIKASEGNVTVHLVREITMPEDIDNSGSSKPDKPPVLPGGETVVEGSTGGFHGNVTITTPGGKAPNYDLPTTGSSNLLVVIFGLLGALFVITYLITNHQESLRLALQKGRVK